ncbi:hypothetical protein V493_01671 [Pseudogymnoascus sp. VKM F-4281 (FW-2241)]|nr:hypothetical protein V493_01671 [Pseudogymnoascus sp. VKM F-4281 (FW-2241)]
MQFYYALFLAFITSGAAQLPDAGTVDYAAIYQCVQDCADDAAVNAGCSTFDYSCQCGNARLKIEDFALTCVRAKCDSSEADPFIELTKEICDYYVAIYPGSSSVADSSSTAVAPSRTGSDDRPTTMGDSAPTATRGSADNTDPTSFSTPSASKSKPVPVGTIVGGVVGGLAVVALFALAVIFVVLRSRRNKKHNPAPPSHQSPQDEYTKPELNPQHPAQPYIPPPNFFQEEPILHPQPNQQAFQHQQSPNSELDSNTPIQAYPQQAFIPNQQPPHELDQRTISQQQATQPELDSSPINPIYSQQPYVPGQVPPQLRDGSTVHEAP